LTDGAFNREIVVIQLQRVFGRNKWRDAMDQSRSAAPLVPAKDALQLDNSNLTIEGSVSQVLTWWSGRFAPSQL